MKLPIWLPLVLFFLSGPPSGIDVDQLSSSVRPQDDFNAYVNSTWIRETPIPADKQTWGAFEILIDESEKNQRAIVEELAASRSSQGTDEQRVGDFYRSYMDTARLEELGSRPRVSPPRLMSDESSSQGAPPRPTELLITQEELERRVALGEWLVVFDGGVYDLGHFREHHPGGRGVLERYRGKDATEAFRAAPHSPATAVLRENYRVAGLAVGAQNVVDPAGARADALVEAKALRSNATLLSPYLLATE